MTPEEFRQAGHAVVDWIAEYRTQIETLPVMAQVEPGAIKASLPQHPPEQAQSFAAVVGDLERIVLPGLSHWQHPRFFGYFPANAALESVLGDLLSTGLGVLGISWQSSPALTEVEEVMTDWMRQMLGPERRLERRHPGYRVDATLVALLCARERATEFLARPRRFAGRAAPTGRLRHGQSHSSVAKAALLAGFGRENVRLVETDAAYAMRPDALDAQVRADLARGLVPAAVVATTGTTATTALDPVAAVARGRADARDVAACRCRHGRIGDDTPRVPVDVGRRRGRRLAGAQSAQMARRGDGLLAVLCPRPGASGAGA